LSCSATKAVGGFVIYGKPNTGGAGNNDWQHTASINVSSLDGTNGFQIYSSDNTIGVCCRMVGDTIDIDHDGYDDIVLYAFHDTYTNALAGTNPAGGIYIIYGRTRANWTTALAGNPALLDIATELSAIPNRATALYTSYNSPWNGFMGNPFPQARD